MDDPACLIIGGGTVFTRLAVRSIPGGRGCATIGSRRAQKCWSVARANKLSSIAGQARGGRGRGRARQCARPRTRSMVEDRILKPYRAGSAADPRNHRRRRWRGRSGHRLRRRRRRWGRKQPS